MKCRPLSVRRLFYVNCIGLLFSMATITLIAFSFTLEGAVFIMGAAEAVCALVWFFVLTQSLGCLLYTSRCV